jgi:HK97 gp10 family phage protein
MTTRGYLSLNGLEAYLEAFAQAGRDVDEAAAHAVVAACDVYLAGMRKRVHKKSGALEKHLSRSEPVRDGNYTFCRVGLLDLGEGKYFPDWQKRTRWYRNHSHQPQNWTKKYYYGMVLEYGTSKKSAYPYIRPAFDEDKSKARKARDESLKRDGVL